MRVFYTNACSISNKWAELKSRFQDATIVAITETWLKPEEQTVNLLPGFCTYRADRDDGRTGGGTMLLVSQYYEQHSVDYLVNSNVQAVGLTCVSGKVAVRIVCVYRSPGASIVENESLLEFIGTQVRTNGRFLLLGDFNAPEINWQEERAAKGTFGHNLLACIHRHTLIQQVETPTRWREGQTPSLLDLVITRGQNDVCKMKTEAPLGRSDHGVLAFNLVVKNSTPPDKFRRAYGKINQSYLIENAKLLNWDVSKDAPVQAQWATIRDNLLALTDMVAPLKKVRRMGNLPWWTSQVIKAQSRKTRAWGRYKHTRGHLRYLQYKAACQRASRIQNECRRKYEAKLAKNAKRNPKAYYNYVQSRAAMRRAVGNVRDASGKHSETNKEKAQSLFKYFETVYQRDKGTDSHIKPQREDIAVMPVVDITEKEVSTALRKLNISKAAGPDGIHPAILKPLADIISHALVTIFRTSLREGVLPADWKTATVTPIHKGGDADLVENYRPVSLTSVVLKTLERILRDKIVAHVTHQKLLSAQQHGFVRKKSCLTNLLCFLDEITKRLDQGQSVEVCYLDFRKAFDTVNHRLLLHKLHAFSLDPVLIRWIEHFLMGRSFQVSVEGEKSQTGIACSGVPQGSVLGPILFLLFVNDLASTLENPCYMFADDVKIVGLPTEESVQRDLDRLFAWSVAWELPLNFGKCQHLVTTKAQHISRVIGPSGNPIQLEKTAVARDLGVLISNDFKPRAQCEAAIKKGNRALHQLRRAVSSRDPTILVPLYKAFVRPHLEYCVQAWCPYLKGETARLEKVQRRFTRWFKNQRELSYDVRLKNLNLFSMKRRRLRGDLIETFKLLKGFTLPGEQTLLCLNKTSTGRGNGMKLAKEHVNSNRRANFFTVRVANYWNKLTADIISANSVSVFKQRLDGAWNKIFAEFI